LKNNNNRRKIFCRKPLQGVEIFIESVVEKLYKKFFFGFFFVERKNFPVKVF